MGAQRRRLVLATRNRGKLVELRQLLAGIDVELVAVVDVAPAVPEVEEDGATFEENAVKKARAVAAATGMAALADDSGLEVDALGGEPGVMSARYAGLRATDEDNNRKLLARLAGVEPDRRAARFRCVVAVTDPLGPLGERALTASGECEGVILTAPRGGGGFGYDPLFYSSELGATFAEAGVGAKSGLSHRARALARLAPMLADYFGVAKAGGTG